MIENNQMYFHVVYIVIIAFYLLIALEIIMIRFVPRYQRWIVKDSQMESNIESNKDPVSVDESSRPAPGVKTLQTEESSCSQKWFIFYNTLFC